MSEVLRAILGFFVMGALCYLLERLWPEDPAMPRWRRDSLTDVLYFALRIALSAALAVATGLTGHALPERGPGLAGSLPFAVQLLVVLFLSDFLQYWAHLLMHVWKPLWHVHAVHHSPEAIDWLVAARVHPFELVFTKVVSSLPLYFLGFRPDVFAVAVPLVATYSLLLHANVSWTFGPLGYVVVSPAFHRWHHASDEPARDKNYAQVFPVIDYLFGTAYFPRGRHPEKYGLVKDTMPDGIWRQFLYPLRAWRRDAGAQPQPAAAPLAPAPGAEPGRVTSACHTS